MAQLSRQNELAELQSEVAQLRARVAHQEEEIAKLKVSFQTKHSGITKGKLIAAGIAVFVILVLYGLMGYVFLPHEIRWIAPVVFVVLGSIAIVVLVLAWKKINNKTI
jgi:protein-S-isoprenylcysteine O-methyltransferase Ste14